jgi:hypothetical protein
MKKREFKSKPQVGENHSRDSLAQRIQFCIGNGGMERQPATPLPQTKTIVKTGLPGIRPAWLLP